VVGGIPTHFGWMDGNIKYTEDKDEDKEKTYNYGKSLVIVE
jgi:hypothetical protein